MVELAQTQLVMIDPSVIETDAAAYQFRSGADAQGVTKAGRHNTDEWNPILHSDPLLVHERLDGKIMVADGHHRLDLAKRANAAGKGPGKIAATVLREADGYTVEDVRVIAAMKNMAYGHSNPVDAAYVFQEAVSGRVHIDLLPSLQMDKGNLQLSYTLSMLPAAALDMVAKGAVPVEAAVKVAETVSDPVRQTNVMKIISAKLGHNAGFVDKLSQQQAPAAVLGR